MGSLLCGLITGPLDLSRDLIQGSDGCPIHFQLPINVNPGKTHVQDKRLRSPGPQGRDLCNWGALYQPHRPQGAGNLSRPRALNARSAARGPLHPLCGRRGGLFPHPLDARAVEEDAASGINPTTGGALKRGWLGLFPSTARRVAGV